MSQQTSSRHIPSRARRDFVNTRESGRWTWEETERLRTLYPHHSAQECAAALDRPFHSVVARARDLGLRKHASFFKRESRPGFRNKAVGADRVTNGVLMRRTDKTRRRANGAPMPLWKPARVLVWEEAHGPVPPGFFVVFKPGMDTTDGALITLDRLELVTKSEQCTRANVAKLPLELQEVALLHLKLIRRIQNRSKSR